tara:strand:- start:103 stop:216 length:114 start_codon:yes stop_codon:yes gene_type:complete
LLPEPEGEELIPSIMTEDDNEEHGEINDAVNGNHDRE